jgi:hypothetical protein
MAPGHFKPSLTAMRKHTFTWFRRLFTRLQENSGDRRDTAYLAQAKDIASLEARMRLIEAERSWW